MPRPGLEQFCSAGRNGGAGGHHVIDQHDRAVFDLAGPGDAESAQHVLLPGAAAQALGGGRGLDAIQRIHSQRPAGLAGKLAGNFGGLIETALPQPPAVRRHRHDHHIIRQCASRPQHGAGHHAREMQAAAMFEREHQLPCGASISEGRAGPGIGRRLGQAGAAAGGGIAFVRQRDAAAGALRRAKGLQLGKAGSAEPIVTIDDFAAAGAARRQHRVNHGAEGSRDQSEHC